MRSLFAALSVLAVSAALVARHVNAEPPPAMESRALTKIIPALEKAKGRRGDLAAVRFYADVFEGTELQAPIGSSLDTLGPWGDNGALQAAEGSLGSCAPLEPAKQQKANALLKEFGNDLPPFLRAYTLGGAGEKKQAADLFANEVQAMGSFGACPSEHPMYSHRRIGRMTIALACVKTFDPKRDVKALEKLLQKATDCAANNHAVG
ncbi:MAG: hypothetical protein U0228_35580 [Myxococcaceae bacterium]